MLTFNDVPFKYVEQFLEGVRRVIPAIRRAGCLNIVLEIFQIEFNLCFDF